MTRPLLRSASTVFVATGVVSLVNYLRDSAVVATLGAGASSDAFFSALLVPTILIQTLLPGILASSLLPVYEQVRGDRRQGALLLGAMAGLVGCGGVALILPAIAWTPRLVAWLLPGFDPSTAALTAEALRWMLMAVPLLAISVLVRAALHAEHRFAVAALTPAATGVTVLVALLAGGTSVGVLALAATAGMALQLVALVVTLRRAGIQVGLPRLRSLPRTAGLDRVATLAAPFSLAAAASFAPTVLERWWASHLAVGTVAHLTLVQRLIGLPLVLVGSSVSTALFPRLAAAAASGDRRRFSESLDEGVGVALPLLLLCAAWLTGAADTVVALLYRHGAFSAADAAATAAVLRSFAWGLPASSLWVVLVKAFMARQDPWTHVALVAALIPADLVLLAVLVPRFGAVGLGLGFSVAVWLGIGLQAGVLARRHQAVGLRRLFGRMALWVPATAAALAATCPFEAPPGGAGLDVPDLILRLLGAGVSGAAAFLLVARLTGRWRRPHDLISGFSAPAGRGGGSAPAADADQPGDDQHEPDEVAPPR